MALDNSLGARQPVAETSVDVVRGKRSSGTSQTVGGALKGYVRWQEAARQPTKRMFTWHRGGRSGALAAWPGKLQYDGRGGARRACWLQESAWEPLVLEVS
jgi:hypothetical protein